MSSLDLRVIQNLGHLILIEPVRSILYSIISFTREYIIIIIRFVNLIDIMIILLHLLFLIINY
jgi:hypothetical protein